MTHIANNKLNQFEMRHEIFARTDSYLSLGIVVTMSLRSTYDIKHLSTLLEIFNTLHQKWFSGSSKLQDF